MGFGDLRRRLCEPLRKCFSRRSACDSAGLHASAAGDPAEPGEFLVPEQLRETLNNLYVSPHSANSWGTDVLGRAALPDGMGTLIVFPPQWRGVCHEDFKLVFSDGTASNTRRASIRSPMNPSVSASFARNSLPHRFQPVPTSPIPPSPISAPA